MFSAFEEPDLLLLRISREYLTSRSEYRSEYAEQLVGAGVHAIPALLQAAIATLQDRMKHKSEDEAEHIAKPLAMLLPKDILKIANAIDMRIGETFSLQERSRMLMAGQVGATMALFDSLLHFDLKIRIIAGLALLEPGQLPQYLSSKIQIMGEGQNLQEHEYNNPMAPYYRIIQMIYAAVLYRAGYEEGTELLQDAKRNLDDTEEERGRSLDQFIEITIKDMAGYMLFKLVLEREDSAGP